MSRLSDYLGRGVVPISQVTMTETTVISPDADFLGVAVLVGAGGAGAFCTGGDCSINGNHRLHAQGGNAGGVCMQLVRFLAGEDYTFTIPDVTAGVGRSTISPTAVATNGPDGGDTTLASTATGFSTITAYGGKGGIAWKQLSSAGTDSTDHAHQTQTWGANADLIFPGGYGGSITIAVTQNTNVERALATGGGAVNLGSLPQEFISGGGITLNHADSATIAATGGGGCMGRGGNVEHTGSGVGTFATGGGSPLGPGTDLSESGTSTYSSVGAIALPFNPNVLFAVDGAAGDGVIGSTSNNGGFGAGGGAAIPTSAISFTAGAGGKFAGGAAASEDYTGGGYPIAGSGDWGGGGGGMASNHSRTADSRGYSGDGGQGVAFIFILSDFGRVLA